MCSNTTMWTIMIIWMVWRHPCLAVSEAQECRQLEYSQPVQDKALNNHLIMRMNTTREDICSIKCFIEPNCLSFNVGPLDGNHQYLCEISDSDDVLHPGDLAQRVGFIYQGTQSPCNNGACVENSICQAGYTNKGYRCICPTGFTGLSCSQDIDECSLDGGHDCHVNADCVNTEGSFNCTCGLGYTGDGRNCTAVNDCSDAPQTTGVYNILNHGLSPFPVYCDQTNDGGGWTMVFKLVGGASPPEVGQLWQSPSTHSENVNDALDTTTTYPGHYKNRIVMNWQTFQPQQARVVLYENGVEVVSLKFNAAGTNNWDWFSQTNLISSPWNDLKTAPFVNFGVIGPVVFDRYFEVTNPYISCPFDTGWLVVTSHSVCLWDKRAPQPNIQYSKQATASFMSDYGNVGIADVFAVFVR